MAAPTLCARDRKRLAGTSGCTAQAGPVAARERGLVSLHVSGRGRSCLGEGRSYQTHNQRWPCH